ncbi:hypothetical protein FH972_026540 [Carpinus fangiana]|uniref:HpcH/HpaI aldolase/citrate lyase domain-containing protein n=1 Tax=Carpinus fangiana TaxID=176857 RepID=A0A5N6L4B8_9ROSI|nr:hypothetical protein FH972_026540 [Carpinus fangiana]
MQAANTLQKTLRSGKPAFGAWQMLPGTNLSRTLCRAGASWILVDCEHGQISDDSMHESVTAIAACAVSPIVRIPAAESWMIKRALDAGAHGIMCPLLQTAADAEGLVKNSKFPPLGKRGYGSPFSMGSFATGDSVVPTQVDYLRQANDTLLTIIQIETKEALENVDAIAAVPGVDVLFVGPFDLGNNIGHPILTGEQDPELKDAIEKIRIAAKKAGKWSGIYCSSGAQAKLYADQGFNMANVTNDVMALGAHFGAQYAEANGVPGTQEKATGPYGRVGGRSAAAGINSCRSTTSGATIAACGAPMRARRRRAVGTRQYCGSGLHRSHCGCVCGTHCGGDREGYSAPASSNESSADRKINIWTALALLVPLVIMGLFSWFSGTNKFPVAGRGMGKGLAILLSGKGANVVIVARNQKKLDEALVEIKRFHAISADVTSAEANNRIIDEVTAWNSNTPPDIVWANAGASSPQLFLDASVDTLRAQMDVNYWAATADMEGKVAKWGREHGLPVHGAS